MKFADFAARLHPGSWNQQDDADPTVRARFWETARTAARHVPFLDEVVAAYFCALDEGTPTRVRATLMAALAYFVLPVDAVPDFLAGIGFTDDIAVLTAAITSVRSHMTPAHRRAARAALAQSAHS